MESDATKCWCELDKKRTPEGFTPSIWVNLDLNFLCILSMEFDVRLPAITLHTFPWKGIRPLFLISPLRPRRKQYSSVQMASWGSLVEAASSSHLEALVTANLQALGLLVDLVKGKGGQTWVQQSHCLTQESGMTK